MSKPTKNFKLSEFTCKGENCCGHTCFINSMLVFILQLIRDHWDKPIYVTSGCRCNVHNTEVEGAEDSEHTKGLGADVKYPQGVSPDEFGKVARAVIKRFRQGGGGVILYDDHCHIDIRHDGPYYRDKRTEAK